MGGYLFLYELDSNVDEGLPHCSGSVDEPSDLAVCNCLITKLKFYQNLILKWQVFPGLKWF